MSADDDLVRRVSAEMDHGAVSMQSALEWERDGDAAWAACPYPDPMIQLAMHANPDRAVDLLLACAEIALAKIENVCDDVSRTLSAARDPSSVVNAGNARKMLTDARRAVDRMPLDPWGHYTRYASIQREALYAMSAAFYSRLHKMARGQTAVERRFGFKRTAVYSASIFCGGACYDGRNMANLIRSSIPAPTIAALVASLNEGVDG